jgi:ribosome-associated toxin RatA of RatAB toxin-antitoxin module
LFHKQDISKPNPEQPYPKIDPDYLLKILVAAQLKAELDAEPKLKVLPTPVKESATPASGATAAKPPSPPPIISQDAFIQRMSELKDAVEQSIEVDADPGLCFQVASDFERYPEWAGSVQYVKILEKNEKGLGKRAEYKVGAFGTSLSYTLEYKFDAPQRMQWTAVAGSVKELLGVYEFSRLADGRTRVCPCSNVPFNPNF